MCNVWWEVLICFFIRKMNYILREESTSCFVLTVWSSTSVTYDVDILWHFTLEPKHIVLILLTVPRWSIRSKYYFLAKYFLYIYIVSYYFWNVWYIYRFLNNVLFTKYREMLFVMYIYIYLRNREVWTLEFVLIPK